MQCFIGWGNVGYTPLIRSNRLVEIDVFEGMNMKKGLICAALSLSVSLNFFSPALAQTAPDRQSVQAQIRKEGMENSQIMKTLSVLTDRYGPRLTGSPNHKAAAEWAAKQMLSWGFSAARLEPWNFGHPGWMNEHASGFLTSPKDQLRMSCGRARLIFTAE